MLNREGQCEVPHRTGNDRHQLAVADPGFLRRVVLIRGVSYYLAIFTKENVKNERNLFGPTDGNVNCFQRINCEKKQDEFSSC